MADEPQHSSSLGPRQGTGHRRSPRMRRALAVPARPEPSHPMSIKATCPSCGVSGRLPDTFRGDRLKCPRCGVLFDLDARGPARDAPIAVSVPSDSPGVYFPADEEGEKAPALNA